MLVVSLKIDRTAQRRFSCISFSGHSGFANFFRQVSLAFFVRKLSNVYESVILEMIFAIRLSLGPPRFGMILKWKKYVGQCGGSVCSKSPKLFSENFFSEVANCHFLE